MQTKVRVVEQKDYYQGYRHLYIDVLDKKEYSDSLDVIGKFSFQTDPEAEQKFGKVWYGNRVVVETDLREWGYLNKMAKLAKFIRENSDSSELQPNELLKLIGAVEHFHYNGRFLPLTYVGMRVYKVMRKNEHYTTFYAASDVLAQKEFDRLVKKNHWDVNNFGFRYETTITENDVK